MFSLIWSKFGKLIAAVFFVVVSFVSVFYSGKKSGESKAKVKAAEDEAKREIAEVEAVTEHKTKVLQNAKETASDNAAIDDNTAVDKLRNNWSRD